MAEEVEDFHPLESHPLDVADSPPPPGRGVTPELLSPSPGRIYDSVAASSASHKKKAKVKTLRLVFGNRDIYEGPVAN
eukprot:gene7665-1371_t